MSLLLLPISVEMKMIGLQSVMLVCDQETEADMTI